MCWHVLLIGAATGGLVGVARDLRRVREFLVASKIPPDRIETIDRATRAHIADAFERLRGWVQPGDGVVVYYSGHGVRLRDPARGDVAYAIVPFDAEATSEFGYVLAEELSVWFWEITAKTHNVTWIADCCYAGGVMRGLRTRGVDERRQSFLSHRERLLATLPAAALDVDGNPYVVRVCASANDLKAFEDSEGGLLTQKLAQTLRELNYAPIVCEDLARRVTGKLAGEQQTPVFAGPVTRVWLTDQTPPPRAFPTAVLHSRGSLILGGRLLNQRPGDRYEVLGIDGRATATLVVTRVRNDRSLTDRDPPDDSTPIIVGATAVLVRSEQPRGAVEVPEGTTADSMLARLLTMYGYVALHGTTSAPLVATVVAANDELRVCTPNGRVVHVSPAAGDLAALVDVVHGLARRAALVSLREPNGAVQGEKFSPAVVARGVEIFNPSPRNIYVSALALRPDGGDELVTRTQPDGELVAPGRTFLVRAWQDNAVDHQLVIVVSGARVDLRGWLRTTPGLPVVHRDDSEPWFAVHVFDEFRV